MIWRGAWLAVAALLTAAAVVVAPRSDDRPPDRRPATQVDRGALERAVRSAFTAATHSRVSGARCTPAGRVGAFTCALSDAAGRVVARLPTNAMVDGEWDTAPLPASGRALYGCCI
jgi:hypothetical protein